MLQIMPDVVDAAQHGGVCIEVDPSRRRIGELI
jgi:hypothetical protein